MHVVQIHCQIWNMPVFAQKSQPFAYSGYVPGRLPANDRYSQRSYCSTFGKNMVILHIQCRILNVSTNLHDMYIFLQI